MPGGRAVRPSWRISADTWACWCRCSSNSTPTCWSARCPVPTGCTCRWRCGACCAVATMRRPSSHRLRRGCRRPMRRALLKWRGWQLDAAVAEALAAGYAALMPDGMPPRIRAAGRWPRGTRRTRAAAWQARTRWAWRQPVRASVPMAFQPPGSGRPRRMRPRESSVTTPCRVRSSCSVTSPRWNQWRRLRTIAARFFA